jgi:putative sigma-54 modulation protein
MVDWGGRSERVQIEISTRHGNLASDQQVYVREKAEKLLKYFARIMAIEVAVDHLKHEWQVEILVSAEHKHDFVATEVGPTPQAAVDQCVHKIEQQLRKYKEKVQERRDAIPQGGISRTHPEQTELPEPKE